MKVMVIGQGGREHALVKAFANSSSVSEIHVVPGNDGMAKEALRHQVSWQDSEALIQLCLQLQIDFVFIGPEDPLVDGLADQLRNRGILVIGPNQEAAMLEGSKYFAKRFMEEAQVPTAKYSLVQSLSDVETEISHFSPPYVLKADGLAAGKGVFICKTKDELFAAARELFEEKKLGEAGNKALLEQFESGWELSYLVLTNGKSWQTLPLAQDHKRLCDNDEGPNTGGMGTVAPLQISEQLRAKIENEIVAKSIHLLDQKKMVFRGVLFIGIMVTESGPKVLEYNTRFGDPETQVILPLIDGDIGELFASLSRGQLGPLKIKDMSAACVVLAAKGYPNSPVKGTPIEGTLEANSPIGYFIHAGTKKDLSQKWIVNGGRVLGAVGFGSNPTEAIQCAYEISNKVSWDGLQKRTDIGAKIKKTNADQEH